MPKRFKQNCEGCKTYYEGWGKRFCSHLCQANFGNPFSGRKHSLETKKVMREKKLGTKQSLETIALRVAKLTGQRRTFSVEARKNMSIARRAVRYKYTGANSPAWISDRTQLVKSEKKHLDGRYREWMRAVKDRDGWKCQIADENCKSRLEAHHILSWMNFPELRYEVNNGIALCVAHHPRARAEEKRLAPLFQELVSVSSE